MKKNLETMFKLAIFLLLETAFCEEIFDSTFSVNDRCINLCRDSSLPRLDLENYEQIVCQKGCRLFNIIHFKDDLNLNTTTKECHLSCNVSYINQREAGVCLTGCNLMSQKRQNEPILSLTESESDSIVLIEPDIEILEADILYDPTLKGQLEVGVNVDYKIPETHIRTMPIENVINNRKSDWFNCLSGSLNLAVVLFFLTGIIIALLMVVWLSSPDIRSSYTEEQDLEKKACLYENCEEPAKDLPPKYSAESEKM